MTVLNNDGMAVERKEHANMGWPVIICVSNFYFLQSTLGIKIKKSYHILRARSLMIQYVYTDEKYRRQIDCDVFQVPVSPRAGVPGVRLGHTTVCPMSPSRLRQECVRIGATPEKGQAPPEGPVPPVLLEISPGQGHPNGN